MVGVILTALYVLAKSGISTLLLPLPVDSIQPVGPTSSPYVAVRASGSTPDDKQPICRYWLLNASSGNLTPLPKALELAGQSPANFVDLIMGNRTVWRIPLAHPSEHFAVATKEDIKNLCFCGETNDACYISDRSSRVIHRFADGKEVSLKFGSSDRKPFRILEYKPGRCLVECLTSRDTHDGGVYCVKRWLSTASLGPIGRESEEDSTDSPSGFISNGLLTFDVPPATPGKLWKAPSDQVVEVQDLIAGRSVAKVQIPWSDGRPAETEVCSSAVSNACAFCVGSVKVDPKDVAQGKGQPYMQKSYYGFRFGAERASLLYRDPWRYSDTGDQSTAYSLTNDGKFLVTTAGDRGHLKVVALGNW